MGALAAGLRTWRELAVFEWDRLGGENGKLSPLCCGRLLGRQELWSYAKWGIPCRALWSPRVNGTSGLGCIDVISASPRSYTVSVIITISFYSRNKSLIFQLELPPLCTVTSNTMQPDWTRNQSVPINLYVQPHLQTPHYEQHHIPPIWNHRSSRPYYRAPSLQPWVFE